MIESSDDRGNRPRVFLSHSSSDRPFIERVERDLQRCQVATWIDVVDIAHGEPWLDAIFEHGIPRCDVVLVYFTSHSLSSSAVREELNASLVKSLKDRSVGLLFYVDSEETRGKLRADIQSRYVPVWNNDNYHEVLPRVVAEVWKYYTGRIAMLVAQQETVRRLEAELELEKIRGQQDEAAFTQREDRDFDFIWGALNRFEAIDTYGITLGPVDVKSGGRPHIKHKIDGISINLASVTGFLIVPRGTVYSPRDNSWHMNASLRQYIEDNSIGDSSWSLHGVSAVPDMTLELLTYGFLEERLTPQLGVSTSHFELIFTQRYYRFRYWLIHNGHLPNEIRFAYERPAEDSSQDGAR